MISHFSSSYEKRVKVVGRGDSPRETEWVRRRQKVRPSVKGKQRTMPRSHTSGEGRKPRLLCERRSRKAQAHLSLEYLLVCLYGQNLAGKNADPNSWPLEWLAFLTRIQTVNTTPPETPWRVCWSHPVPQQLEHLQKDLGSATEKKRRSKFQSDFFNLNDDDFTWTWVVPLTRHRIFYLRESCFFFLIHMIPTEEHIKHKIIKPTPVYPPGQIKK